MAARESRDGDIFYDVGANIGLYSLYAAKLRPTCRVFAFEPVSHNFGNLCENLLLNRVANVTPAPSRSRTVRRLRPFTSTIYGPAEHSTRWEVRVPFATVHRC